MHKPENRKVPIISLKLCNEHIDRLIADSLGLLIPKPSNLIFLSFSAGRLRNARHWDWLGQALEAGFLRGQPPDKGSAPTSKEQLLLERRQKLQGKIGLPQVRPPSVTFNASYSLFFCIADCIY